MALLLLVTLLPVFVFLEISLREYEISHGIHWSLSALPDSRILGEINTTVTELS